MKKQLFFAVSLVLALVLSSCNKDLKPLDPSLFTCTPNPLELKGGKVDATITGTFPVKYFSRNATVTVTPVLKFNGQEVKGTPSVFQGEKVTGNDQTIAYKAGGSYTIKTSFNYVPEMAKSELYLDFSVATKKKTYTLPQVKVADGVIATAALASTNFGTGAANGPVIVADKFQRVIQEMQEADILFLIQQSQLRNSETKSSDIVELTKKIKEAKETANKEVSGLEIAGYASPDGALDINTNLAEKRQKVTSDFINKEIKKLKTTVTVDSKFTAEDWDGFQKLMENSNIQDKQVILRVLSMYTDPEQREREIKNLSVAFKSIADEILPQLRRSRLKLTVDVTGKSDAEIAKLAKEDAVKLTVEELLYAATLTSDLNEKAALYTKATDLYPGDLRGWNNLGVVKYQQGNIDDAARLFNKALEVEPKCVNASYNAGLCALAKGDLAKAEEFFGKAAGTSGNLSNALGTVYILKGDYAKAKTAFGSTATNNAALLQILDGNYNGARNTLAAVAEPDALTAYLGAIVGARTNNRDAVFSNLKTAVSLKPACKTKAASDLEFAKFFTDETFISIVK
ncbi:MAG: tetratricopeptide repeat protein [Paludibacter sp.]|jgi:tetratricopeptide (TPR) repeat protein|nr:tetratricopeptide repeat protein [Paludibacter sp.]